MDVRVRWTGLLLLGAGLAIGLVVVAQQAPKEPESAFERAARRAWADLEAGQSETFVASAVQARVEASLPPREAVDARRTMLLEALDTDRPAVQWAALVSLHHYGAPDTPLLGRLVHLAVHPQRRVRVAAATTIGSLRAVDDEGARLLRDAAASESALLAANALRALARTRGGERLLPTLLAALGHADVRMRRAAAYGIARIDMEPQPDDGDYPFQHVVTPLRTALRDEDREVRAYAAMALGRMGPMAAPAVDELIERIDAEEDANVRSWAATALGSVGRPALAALEAHVSRSQRVAMGYWALKLVGNEAVPALRRLLDHETPHNRLMAARTLHELDVDRAQMIERIERIANDDDLDALVRDAARETLRKIRGPQ